VDAACTWRAFCMKVTVWDRAGKFAPPVPTRHGRDREAFRNE
jgi:hypothetical protein